MAALFERAGQAAQRRAALDDRHGSVPAGGERVRGRDPGEPAAEDDGARPRGAAG